MSSGSVTFERDGPIGRVVFDRPNARNAMTWSMYQYLAARLADITARLAAHAPVAMRVTKEEVRRFLAEQLAEGGEDLVRECYGSADFFEGVQAFREKPRINWSGC